MNKPKLRFTFALLFLTSTFFVQYILLHLPITPFIVIGIPLYLVVQTWILYVFDFYDNIKLNVLSNILFFVIASFFELIKNNDFLYYFKDLKSMTAFILIFWATSSTMYIAMLFEHWFAKVSIASLIQWPIFLVYFFVAYQKFSWTDSTGAIIEIKLFSIWIMVSILLTIFIMQIILSKLFSKKITINKKEVF